MAVCLIGPAAAQQTDLKAGNIRIPGADPATVSRGLQWEVQDLVDKAAHDIRLCTALHLSNVTDELKRKLNKVNESIDRTKESMKHSGADPEKPDPNTWDGRDLIRDKGDASNLADIINRLKLLYKFYCVDHPDQKYAPEPPKPRPRKKLSEDNPLYMDGYQAPKNTKPTPRKKDGDAGSGPSREDIDRQTDAPKTDAPNDADKQPEIPLPH